MSVEKFNPSICGETIPFIQVNREVIQHINNPEAGFIWVYLLSLPPDWEVVKAHVQKHFGIGVDKLKRIFAWLSRHKLIEYTRGRRPDGKMGKTHIRILNGSKFIFDTKEVIHTTGVKTTPLENHACGKQQLHIRQQHKEEKKHRERPRQKTALPLSPSFSPSEESKALCKSRNLDVNFVLEKFKASAKASGKAFADPDAGFQLFVMNEKTPEAARAIAQASIVNEIDIDSICHGCGRPPKGCQCHQQVRLPKEIAQAFSREALARLGKGKSQH